METIHVANKLLWGLALDKSEGFVKGTLYPGSAMRTADSQRRLRTKALESHV